VLIVSLCPAPPRRLLSTHLMSESSGEGTNSSSRWTCCHSFNTPLRRLPGRLPPCLLERSLRVFMGPDSWDAVVQLPVLASGPVSYFFELNFMPRPHTPPIRTSFHRSSTPKDELRGRQRIFHPTLPIFTTPPLRLQRPYLQYPKRGNPFFNTLWCRFAELLPHLFPFFLFLFLSRDVTRAIHHSRIYLLRLCPSFLFVVGRVNEILVHWSFRTNVDEHLRQPQGSQPWFFLRYFFAHLSFRAPMPALTII